MKKKIDMYKKTILLVGYFLVLLLIGCNTIPKEYKNLCERYKVYYDEKEDFYVLKIRNVEFGGYMMAKYNGDWYGYTYIEPYTQRRAYSAGPYETLDAAVQAQELRVAENKRINFDNDFNIITNDFETFKDDVSGTIRVRSTQKKRKLIQSKLKTICE
jgi:hypothetical protein